MKLTGAYGKKMLALKAAVLAPALSLLKTAIENDFFNISEDFKPEVIVLSTAIFIFLFDLLFNAISLILNSIEIYFRLKKIDNDIRRLNDCIDSNSPNHIQKKVNKKISDLNLEKISLIAN